MLRLQADWLGRSWDIPGQPLTIAQLDAVEAAPSAIGRAQLALEAAGVAWRQLPLGVALSLGQQVYQLSADPGFDGVLEEEWGSSHSPHWVQECLIATAYPNYDFEAQRRLTVEQWLRLWVRTHWKLVKVMGVDPQQLSLMLLTPEDRERTLSEMQEQQAREARQAAWETAQRFSLGLGSPLDEGDAEDPR